MNTDCEWIYKENLPTNKGISWNLMKIRHRPAFATHVDSNNNKKTKTNISQKVEKSVQFWEIQRSFSKLLLPRYAYRIISNSILFYALGNAFICVQKPTPILNASISFALFNASYMQPLGNHYNHPTPLMQINQYGKLEMLSIYLK